MIKIVTTGGFKDPVLKESFDEYKTRLSRFTRLEVLELKAKAKKGILSHLKEGDFVVALDEKGKHLSSHELSDLIRENYLSKNLVFAVGGPSGLDKDVLERADIQVSISKMTFTSQMARLLLIEQIYRAFTIIKGVEYHK